MHYFQIELYEYGRDLMTSSLVLLMMEELTWLQTVSSTFRDLQFDGSL